jgi:hypothetical protein
MNEAQARAAITVQHIAGYTTLGGEKVAPVWELTTPDGWCWETDRHTNCCFSRKQAQQERATQPIIPCGPDCMMCGEDSQ